jgi:hypothetical protein
MPFDQHFTFLASNSYHPISAGSAPADWNLNVFSVLTFVELIDLLCVEIHYMDSTHCTRSKDAHARLTRDIIEKH